MTACILTGFAKKQKFVGNVYACNGSDLPATQDFGTVQYQGPSETALTVPATTVTYTIIGKTQCGDDIRRITTKTYSSRAVAGKTDALSYPNILNYPYANKVVQPYNTLGILSATGVDAVNMVLAYANATFPEQAPWTFSRSTTPNSTSWQFYLFNGSMVELAGGGTQIGFTIYYLDVHEVWTYDLV